MRFPPLSTLSHSRPISIFQILASPLTEVCWRDVLYGQVRGTLQYIFPSYLVPEQRARREIALFASPPPPCLFGFSFLDKVNFPNCLPRLATCPRKIFEQSSHQPAPQCDVSMIHFFVSWNAVPFHHGRISSYLQVICRVFESNKQ